MVAAVCQPGEWALESDAAHEVDVGNTLPLAESGHSTQVLVLVVLQRLVPARSPQVLGEAFGLAKGVLGVRDAGAVRQAAAREVGHCGDVSGSPGVVDDAFVPCDAEVRKNADAAARFQREVRGADHRVGLHAGSPDEGIGFEFLGQGLVREVDQLQRALGAVQGSVQEDLDAAAAEVLHNPFGLRCRDLGHDASHGFDQDKAHFFLADAGVVPDRGAGQVFHLGDALDAGEAATHNHEGQGLGAGSGVRDGGSGFDALQHLVAEGHGLFDGLQADALVRQPLDGERAGDGARGNHNVEVGNLDVLSTVRGCHNGCAVRVVDRSDAALDEFSLLQVLAVRDHCVAGFDVAACYFGQEGLVGHVGQWIHEGDDATGIRDLLLQFECYVQADVSAADDEYPGTVLELWGGCHDLRIQHFVKIFTN